MAKGTSRKGGTRLDRRPPATTTAAAGLRNTVLVLERAAKVAVWDCRMCGQCILHSTGMVCPMRCPKNLRNGPCGGVYQDGSCEVLPDRPCVWVEAWNGSRRMPVWGNHIHHIQKPVDWRLQETSSWENHVTGRDDHAPPAWRAYEEKERAT